MKRKSKKKINKLITAELLVQLHSVGNVLIHTMYIHTYHTKPNARTHAKADIRDSTVQLMAIPLNAAVLAGQREEIAIDELNPSRRRSRKWYAEQ